MRLKLLYAAVLLHFHAFGQVQKSQELYQKIENYYILNAGKVEVISQIFKSALSYDTSRSFSTYLKLPDNSFVLSYLDSTFSVKTSFLYSGKYYATRRGTQEKIQIKGKDLEGSSYSSLKFIPAYNTSELESRFGEIKSFLKTKSAYLVFTSKYSLTVDTLTYRITSLVEIVPSEGKLQYRKMVFTIPPDSIQRRLKEEAEDIIHASASYHAVTLKQIKKNSIPVTSHKGEGFSFTNLVSLNKGMLD